MDNNEALWNVKNAGTVNGLTVETAGTVPAQAVETAGTVTGLAVETPVKVPGLTVETVLELWSKTYNTDGKPDWSHIFPYYRDDIVFQDSIQKIVGIYDFKAMCNRLTKRCKKLRMDIISITSDSNIIMMDWVMTMSFRKSPDTPMYGCTKLTLDSDGRILEQRDYYDLWGDIYNGIPGFGKLYRKFMRKFFG